MPVMARRRIIKVIRKETKRNSRTPDRLRKRSRKGNIKIQLKSVQINHQEGFIKKKTVSKP
jgi:UPF0288 family protein (methanogenesis marker protein 3)